jgi:sarcosine oxidase, subunit gamma
VPEQLPAAPALGRPAGQARGIRLAERTGLGKIDLRGDAHDRGFMAGVGRVLDMVLPTDPCTSAGKDQITALWLGPDQWLITAPAADVATLMSALREALDGVHSAITDVSDGRVALRLAGPSARAVLAKGCPLDLHPRAFPPGSVAGSVLAKTEVLLHLVGEDEHGGPAFDLYVGRSFAHYLWAWLTDAGLEYGVQVERAA